MLLGLVIAGGESSRMKTDKGSLQIRQQSQRQRTAHLLQDFVSKVYLSLKEAHAPKAREEGWQEDQLLFDSLKDIGPAAALLAASQKNPGASWLVMACDFPLAEKKAIQNLKEAHQKMSFAIPAVTSFQNAEGIPEPLFAIWTPGALKLLASQVAKGKLSPLQTLRQCQLQPIIPEKQEWLLNANTPEQWDQVVQKESPLPPGPRPPAGSE